MAINIKQREEEAKKRFDYKELQNLMGKRKEAQASTGADTNPVASADPETDDRKVSKKEHSKTAGKVATGIGIGLAAMGLTVGGAKLSTVLEEKANNSSTGNGIEETIDKDGKEVDATFEALSEIEAERLVEAEDLKNLALSLKESRADRNITVTDASKEKGTFAIDETLDNIIASCDSYSATLEGMFADGILTPDELSDFYQGGYFDGDIAVQFAVDDKNSLLSAIQAGCNADELSSANKDGASNLGIGQSKDEYNVVYYGNITDLSGFLQNFDTEVEINEEKDEIVLIATEKPAENGVIPTFKEFHDNENMFTAQAITAYCTDKLVLTYTTPTPTPVPQPVPEPIPDPIPTPPVVTPVHEEATTPDYVIPSNDVYQAEDPSAQNFGDTGNTAPAQEQSFSDSSSSTGAVSQDSEGVEIFTTYVYNSYQAAPESFSAVVQESTDTSSDFDYDYYDGLANHESAFSDDEPDLSEDNSASNDTMPAQEDFGDEL